MLPEPSQALIYSFFWDKDNQLRKMLQKAWVPQQRGL